MKNTIELSKIGFNEMSTQEMHSIQGGHWVKKLVWDLFLGKMVEILVEEASTYFNHGTTTPPKPNPNACDNV